MLIVVHDAGAAEVIAAWTQNQTTESFAFILEGPAVRIFERVCGDVVIRPRQDLDALLREHGFVLCGSGWGSDLERVALVAARRLGVRSAVYLDHWTQYPERFSRDGVTILPDEMWAGDEHALTLARSCFPDVPSRLEPNRYFSRMASEVQSRSEEAEDGVRVLFIAEPISESAIEFGGNPFGFSEFDGIDNFLQFVVDTGIPVTTIRLRLHPAESPAKYVALVRNWQTRLPIEISHLRHLSADLAWATWVVGFDSMALAVAAFAGKRVSSAIPAHGRPKTIPLPQIESLFQ